MTSTVLNTATLIVWSLDYPKAKLFVYLQMMALSTKYIVFSTTYFGFSACEFFTISYGVKSANPEM